MIVRTFLVFVHTIPLVLILLKEAREAQDVLSLHKVLFFQDHLVLAITNVRFVAMLLMVLFIWPVS